jgi:hypothetical protein
MKKVFFLALFILGICNASAFGMEQEIVLNELYSIAPLDDANRETLGERPDPNQIRATINGNQLFIESDRHEPIYVEVISKKGGQIVAAGEFIGNSTITIPRSGAYTLQVYCNNTLFIGDFEVE